MNIKKENIDDLNAVLSISLEKDDYESRVDTVLKDYRKKARIDGFRPGKVPMGLITKMYRKPILVEEVNKLVSESITKFLVDEKLNILGEPIPHETEEINIDWDNDSKFEFKFDLGIAPEFDLKLSAKDKVPQYEVKADKALVDKYVESYTQRMGEYTSADKVSEKDILKATIVQLDENGVAVEDGVSVEEASLMVDVVKDDKVKKSLMAVKKGDTLNIDLKKAYPSDVELSSLLKIDKEKVAEIGPMFNLTITDISHFEPAQVNQELFDKIYGENTVKSEKEFREKIAEEAKSGLARDSEYRLGIDIKEMLLKKFKAELPNEFLKRWLYLINEGKFSKEDIDKEFDHFEEDLKWQLIKDKISAEHEIKIEEKDIMGEALNFARMQFAQYGMNNVPDEHLVEFARRMLERKEDANRIQNQVVERKVIDAVKSVIKLEEKEISSEKFNKLFEK